MSDGLRLTVLGCSGSVPGPDSPASGYLIEADGYRLVLDLGHGAFGALQRHLAPRDIDGIVVSHLHADHCVDLTALVVALRYGGVGYRLDRPDARVPIVGVPGTRARVEAAYDPLARKLSQKYTGVSRTLGEVLYPLLLAAECGLQAANVRLLNRSKLALP